MRFDVLKERARLLDRLRGFFRDRGFLEVATPLVSDQAIPERHIRLTRAGPDWLQASPEMHHKRLLCAGSGPIFEVTRSFRGGERGELHRPEFTIVEWYRPGDDLAGGMELLSHLVGELLTSHGVERVTYREAFERSIGFDPHAASDGVLQALPDAALSASLRAADADRDEWLNAWLATRVEPTLGVGRPELLFHYPASQAALATTATDEQGVSVAERFELYVDGVELANGYRELTDPIELRRRLELANAQRAAAGAPELPLPHRLLADMTSPGLPPCAGVALGFDRLVMVAVGAESIGDVLAIDD